MLHTVLNISQDTGSSYHSTSIISHQTKVICETHYTQIPSWIESLRKVPQQLEL